LTIRRVINNRIRLSNIAIFGGMLVSAGLTQYQLNQNQEPAAWSFAGFFIGFAAMLAIKHSTKCPSCKGNIGSTLMNSGHFVSLPKKIKYCPLCGVDIDTKQ
jgi:hypothetical protein